MTEMVPQSTFIPLSQVIHKAKKCIKGSFFEQSDRGSVPD